MSQSDTRVVSIQRADEPGLFLLKPRDYGGCPHDRFVVDEGEREVECRKCGKKLDPMEAMIRLAKSEALQRASFVIIERAEYRYYRRQIKRLLKRRGMPEIHVTHTRVWLTASRRSVEMAKKARELESVLREVRGLREQARRKKAGVHCIGEARP